MAPGLPLALRGAPYDPRVDRQGNNLMRSLGQFFGHLGQAIRTDPAKADKTAPEKHEVRREVEEREETTPDGRKVTVRRTTIEEIELEPRRKPSGDAP